MQYCFYGVSRKKRIQYETEEVTLEFHLEITSNMTYRKELKELEVNTNFFHPYNY